MKTTEQSAYYLGIYSNEEKVDIKPAYFKYYLLGVIDSKGRLFIKQDTLFVWIHSVSWNYLNWLQARISKQIYLPRKKLIRLHSTEYGKIYRLQYKNALCMELLYYIYTDISIDDVPFISNINYTKALSILDNSLFIDIYNKSTHRKYKGNTEGYI